MKIIVPTGGGTESGCLLAWALENTKHEIVALHVREDFGRHYWQGVVAAEAEKAFNAVADWCNTNIRAVQKQIADPIHLSEVDPEYQMPVRPGFTRMRYVYWALQKWGSIGRAVEQVQADQVWNGLSTWNSRGSEDLRKACYLRYSAETKIPLRRPFLKNFAPEKGARLDGANLGAGRFLIRSHIPSGLRPHISICGRQWVGKNCGSCQRCTLWQFGKKVCDGRSRRTIHALDGRIEELGRFGKGHSWADPATYEPNDIYEILKHYDAWNVMADEIEKKDAGGPEPTLVHMEDV